MISWKWTQKVLVAMLVSALHLSFQHVKRKSSLIWCIVQLAHTDHHLLKVTMEMRKNKKRKCSDDSPVAQLVEHGTGMLLTKVRFPSMARDFSPRVNFQCRLSYSVCTPPGAVACIYICAHVKDSVVCIRVQCFMAIHTYPAHTIVTK